MQQLAQTLKDGQIRLVEAPFPAVGEGMVLVRNHFSVISVGTEGRRVKDARLGYVAKARARRAEVKQVVDTVRKIGISETYRRVRTRLDALSSLGYSSAGEVIEVGSEVRGIRVGDLVACAGGQQAVHGEIISVPENLCSKVPKGLSLEYAAFATVGAIAVQGVRQSGVSFGESCVVIGLGLIGQLTARILEAIGVRVIGIDIDHDKVAFLEASGVGVACDRNDESLKQIVAHETNGHGVDAAIITASSSSTDPVNIAGELCRKKGRVVVVGAVPTGFGRPTYYKKELDLRMSCSYGPGRYDRNYEEKNVDYPFEYVRWTASRNMGAFLDLVAAGKLNVESLITHRYPFDSAEEAYNTILSDTEKPVGVVLAYDTGRPVERRIRIRPDRSSARVPEIRVGFIGAGSFAQKTLIPLAKKKAELVGVATAKSVNARDVAERNGFAYSTGSADDLLNDDGINTIFIATRHDLHADFVVKALRNSKHVFVEKPLCLSMEDLETIREKYDSSSNHLMVGFNRRFAPLVSRLMEEIPGEIPRAINYRINVGETPRDHWTLDGSIGGGRILGEVCHFVDLAMFIASSRPTHVFAQAIPDEKHRIDTLTISLAFENDSIANISYFANGSKALPKEYLEVFCGGKTCILDDFQRLAIFGAKKTILKTRVQDKGHGHEIDAFFSAIKGHSRAPIPFAEIYDTTLTTFKVIESIQRRKVIDLNLY